MASVCFCPLPAIYFLSTHCVMTDGCAGLLQNLPATDEENVAGNQSILKKRFQILTPVSSPSSMKIVFLFHISAVITVIIMMT